MNFSKREHADIAIALISVVLIAGARPAYAQAFRSPAYCAQLAEIGSNAYRTKKDGYPIETVLKKVGDVLSDNPQKKQAAQGVVTAIYGDASIRSSKQAYDTVYAACKL